MLIDNKHQIMITCAFMCVYIRMHLCMQGSFRKLVKGGGNVNLKNCEGATYKVIIACLLANKLQRERPPPLLNEILVCMYVCMHVSTLYVQYVCTVLSMHILTYIQSTWQTRGSGGMLSWEILVLDLLSDTIWWNLGLFLHKHNLDLSGVNYNF